VGFGDVAFSVEKRHLQSNPNFKMIAFAIKSKQSNGCNQIQTTNRLLLQSNPNNQMIAFAFK